MILALTSARDSSSRPMSEPVQPTLLYCRCAYAQVVPAGLKDDVLQQLCASEVSFESVADLCEMAAHRDPRLAQLQACATQGGLRIAACYPRAVRGLFVQAGVPLPEAGVEILNMREQSSDAVVAAMIEEPARVS